MAFIDSDDSKDTPNPDQPDDGIAPTEPEGVVIRVKEYIQDNRKAVIGALMERYGLRGKTTINDTTRLFFMGEIGEPIGFALITPGEKDEKIVQLNWIYVKKACREAGLARTLFDKVLDAYPDKEIRGKIVDRNGKMEHLAEEAGAQPLEGEDRVWSRKAGEPLHDLDIRRLDRSRARTHGFDSGD